MITELSETGMTVVTGRQSSLGEELTSAFQLDSADQPFQLHTVVRHRSAQHTGLEFLNITRVDRLRLLSFIVGRSGQYA
jgi:c-di-GMP-binding flagellar brake protein YcgR